MDRDSEGEVLESRRPAKFVFQWCLDNASYATTIKIDFEAIRDGTVICFRESGYDDTPSGRAALLECAAG